MKKSTALQTLGLKEGASDEDIKKAHRKLIIENHPDKFGQDAQARAKAEEKTKRINEARDVLLNHSWDPEHSTAGTPYGAPFTYDPFAAARASRTTHNTSSTQHSPDYAHNPFADWPFTESFVWTTWDSSGNQYTYRSGEKAHTSGHHDPFGYGPFGTTNPFASTSSTGSHYTRKNTASASENPFRATDPFQSNDPFTSTFFNFANLFTREVTLEEKLQQAKRDLSFDIKLVVAKLAILALSLLLSSHATGLYLYTIISIGQGIWKRLKALSLIFILPFAMLAIIFVPSGNETVGLLAFILFFCAVAFDLSNIYRHIQRIRAIKKQME